MNEELNVSNINDFIQFVKSEDDPKDVEVVKMLVNNGLSITDPNLFHAGLMPLHLAVYRENFGIVKYLIEAGANINAQTQDDGYTALNYAVRNENKQVFDFLISKGADIHVRDIDEWTVLTSACFMGNYQMIGTLIRLGADVNHTDIYDKTPIYEIEIDAPHYRECITAMVKEFARLAFENLPLNNINFQFMNENQLAKDFLKGFKNMMNKIVLFKEELSLILDSAVTAKNDTIEVLHKLNIIFGTYFPDTVKSVLAENLTSYELPL